MIFIDHLHRHETLARIGSVIVTGPASGEDRRRVELSR